MRDALQLSPFVGKRTMTPVLKGDETLMKISAGSTKASHVRFEKIEDGWIASR